jgi:dienelactone hydrolase
VGTATLEGDLAIPLNPRAVVAFAHGSGSGRRSLRNRYVAQELQNAGLATLLLDLLTEEEERIDARTAALRFDIGLLADRVMAAVDWLSANPGTSLLRIGLFGASTGAAAALVAAARRPGEVSAVVSRGGRPDLAGSTLERVQAPTLLIVGGEDLEVLRLNEMAQQRMKAETKLVVVAGATHLFEEEGALEQVALLAADWFVNHL